PWTTPPAHLPWGRDVSGTQDVPVFMPDGRLVVIGMTDRPLGVGPIGLGDFMAAAALGPIVPGARPPQAAAPPPAPPAASPPPPPPVPPAASPQRQKVTPRPSFARNQSLRGRAIALTVRCSAPCARVRATGRLVVGRARYQLARLTRTAGPGAAKLRLSISKPAFSAAKRALARGRRVTADVVVTGLDRAGRALGQRSISIGLRR